MFFCNVCNNLIYFHKIELNTLICNACRNQKKSISNLIIKYKIWTPNFNNQLWNLNIIKMCLNSSAPVTSKFSCNRCENTKLVFFLKKDENSITSYFFCPQCKCIYVKK